MNAFDPSLLLFVPGDRPDRFAKALESGASGAILDLEDAVSPDRKAVAREAVRAFLEGAADRSRVAVRMNPPAGDDGRTDLAMQRPLRRRCSFPKSTTPRPSRASPRAWAVCR